MGRRVKNILGLVRDKGVEASSNTVTIADRHARAQEFLSFPKAGWISLADCNLAEVSLSRLSMGAVVSYFLLQRAADGIQRANFCNLSKESFALYKKSYGREGEVSVQRDLFFFVASLKLL